MVELQYITAPLLGGIIGYITNDIAIRMLFRPREAVYICGWHVPFTPGIIPKGKGRIADSIGQVISQNLMNKEVLENHLLSKDMIQKVRNAVEKFIEMQKTNEETVKEFLAHYLKEEDIESIAQNINNSLTEQMQSKMSDPAVGNKVSELAMDYVANKLNSEGVQIILGGMGGLLGGLPGGIGAVMIGKFLGMLREPAQKLLADNINTMLQKNGKQMVSNMIGDEVQSFLNKKICILLEGRDEQLSQVVNTVETLYSTVIKEQLPHILESVDISKVVHDRIMEMDVAETEKLIFQVMDKELKAIVWLGAGLGLIMGGINCLI